MIASIRADPKSIPLLYPRQEKAQPWEAKVKQDRHIPGSSGVIAWYELTEAHGR